MTIQNGDLDYSFLQVHHCWLTATFKEIAILRGGSSPPMSYNFMPVIQSYPDIEGGKNANVCVCLKI